MNRFSIADYNAGNMLLSKKVLLFYPEVAGICIIYKNQSPVCQESGDELGLVFNYTAIPGFIKFQRFLVCDLRSNVFYNQDNPVCTIFKRSLYLFYPVIVILTFCNAFKLADLIISRISPPGRVQLRGWLL